MDWRSDFMEAKYHLTVANRMMNAYNEYPEKRFLVGIINESAKCAGKLVRSFLILSKTKGDLKTFQNKVGPKYLSQEIIINISKTLEVEKAQKISPIEFAKNGKIILLINEKYRVITVDRLKEFLKSIDEGIRIFDDICRHI